MTLTPEQFLALPADPEDEDQEPEQLDPLESIADSLRCMHVLLERVAAIDLDNLDRPSPTEQDEQRQRFDDLDQAYADLEVKHDTLRALVEEIEGIVKPSTSKLANSVRDAVQRWCAPEVPVAEPEPVEAVAAWNPEKVGYEAPGPDASVEEWRACARALGFTGPDVDTMNRSQIRTMLGIAQPISEVSA